MKRLFWILCFIGMSIVSLLAQSWNLVWHEDFGTVEDSVIMDFPDPSMTVPDHQFDECWPIQDGYYGITNSTWWAFNRKKSCGMSSAAHFTVGGDHTGNKNGGMLVVNVGSEGNGEVIYGQTMKFDMCKKTKYKFSIFGASVSFSSSIILLSNLTLNIINEKDPANPVVIASKSTGDLPLWPFNNSNNANPDGIYTHKVQPWSEYSVEFEAEEGDVLTLQVLNHCSSGLGNDFALDDISLYRLDEKEVVQPKIKGEQSSYRAADNHCIESVRYSVTNNVLSSWKKIYDKVYFLWQKSDDNGFSWSNVPNGGGLEKTELIQDMETSGYTPSTVYRLIITGGDTETDAKTEAEYIGEHNGPSSGCVYYSISHTVAAVLATQTCEFKNNLKTIWKESFCFLDSLTIRGYGGAADLSAFDTLQSSAFSSESNYAVTCAPDVSIFNSVYGANLPPSETYKTLGHSGTENDAYLYMKVPADGEQHLMIDQIIPSHFCDCQSYMLNGYVKVLDPTGTLDIRACVDDDEGHTFFVWPYTVKGSNKDWTQIHMPSSPNSIANIAHLRFYCTNKGTVDVPVVFDDLSYNACNVEEYQAMLGIDNKPNLKYYGVYDCNDPTEEHSVTLYDDEWSSSYGYHTFIWQYSSDGVTWKTLPYKDRTIQHDNSIGGAVFYRAILAEKDEVAQQIAETGFANDYCDRFFITDPVTISCKKCYKPEFSRVSDSSKVICFWKNITEELVVKRESNTPVNELLWYQKTSRDPDWTLIPDAKSETLSVPANFSLDTMLYMFYATHEKCISDSIIFQRIYRPVDSLSPALDAHLCQGADAVITLQYFTRDRSTRYVINGDTMQNDRYVVKNNLQQDLPCTMYTTDGICNSNVVNFTIFVEDSVDFQLKSVPSTVCQNEEVDLKAIADFSPDKKFEWRKNGLLLTSSELEVKDVLTESATYEFVAWGEYCPQKTELFRINVEETPTLTINAEKTLICDESDLPIDLSLEHPGLNQDNLIWESMYEDETSFFPAIRDTLFGHVAYRVRYISPYGCDDVYSNTIDISYEIVKERPLLLNNRICEGMPVTLTPQVGNNSIIWIKDGVDTLTSSIDYPERSCDYTYVIKRDECSDITDIRHVAVEGFPDLKLSASDTLVCENEVSISVTSPFSIDKVVWEKMADDATSFEVIDTTAETTKSVSEMASYRAYVISLDPCASTYTDTVTILSEPKVEPTIMPLPSSVCEGTTLNLEAVASMGENNSFAWIRNGDTLTKSDLILSDIPDETSTYEFVVKGKVCPKNSQTMTVNVTPLPDVKITASSDVFCEGDHVTLSLSLEDGIDQVMWEAMMDNETEFATMAITDGNTRIVSDAASYRAYVLTSGICGNVYSDTILVSSEPKVEPTITPLPSAVCEGSSLDLVAVATMGENNRYAWIRNGDTLSTNELKLSDIPNSKTTYEFVVTGKACPKISQKMSVDVEKMVVLSPSDFDVPTIVCEGENIDLKANLTLPSNLSFAWVKDGDTLSKNTMIYNDAFVSSAAYEFVVYGNVCPKESVHFLVNESAKPQVSISASENYVCEGSDVTLTLNQDNADKIEWQAMNYGETEFNTITMNQLTQQIMEPISYRVIASAGVCTPDTSDVVSIDVERKVKISYDLPSQICDSMIITQSPAWLTYDGDDIPYSDRDKKQNRILGFKNGNPIDYVNGEVSTSSSSLDVIKEPTTFQFVSKGEACPSDTLKHEIAVSYHPTVQIETLDDSICAGSPVNVQVTGENLSSYCPYIETRDENEAAFSRYDNSTDCLTSDYQFEQIDKSVYVRVKIDGGLCPDTFSNELFVHVDQPNDITLNPVTVCEGESVSLKPIGVNSYTAIMWTSAEDGYVSVIGEEVTLNVTPGKDTEYRVTVQNGLCEDVADADVHIQSNPVIVSCEPLEYGKCQVEVESPSNLLTYDYGARKTTSNILEHMTMGFDYQIIVMDEFECSDTLDYKYTIDLEIPEYFVEGRETWKVTHLEEYKKATYKIFDRYGKVLYEGVSSDEGWNGLYLGHSMPSTDYWYEVNIPEIDRQYSGHFTLLRQPQ